MVLQTVLSALWNRSWTERGAGGFYPALTAEEYHMQQCTEMSKGKEKLLGSYSRVFQEAKISTELNIQ